MVARSWSSWRRRRAALCSSGVRWVMGSHGLGDIDHRRGCSNRAGFGTEHGCASWLRCSADPYLDVDDESSAAVHQWQSCSGILGRRSAAVHLLNWSNAEGCGVARVPSTDPCVPAAIGQNRSPRRCVRERAVRRLADELCLRFAWRNMFLGAHMATELPRRC